MILPEQETYIRSYLKSIGINTQEFFEEMYDHICSSFENRQSKNQSIQDHIKEQVQPDFGGVSGIQKIKEKRNALRIKQMRKRFFEIFKQYLFGWPSIIATVLIVLVDFLIYENWGGKALTLFSFIAFGIIPVVYFYFRQLKFYIGARRRSLGYNTSEKFNAFSAFMILLVSIPNIIISSSNIWFDEKSGSVLSSATVAIPMSIIITLFFITTLQLFKEEFTFKLTLK